MENSTCIHEYFPEEFQIACASIGIATISLIIIILLVSFYQLAHAHLISRLCKRDIKYFGQWAVITGGSSGIGKAYAAQLAKQGMDIILISNELEALRTTVTDIIENYGVQCSFVHVDFMDGEHAYREIVTELEGKDIGILINCAGILGNLPCMFLNENEKNTLIMIELHIRTVVQLTHIVLPSMLSKKRGIIVNVSSLSSLMPFPTYNVYSSCKAFSDRFSRAISYEYSNDVHVQSLVPYFVKTRMIEHFIDTLPGKACILPVNKLVRHAVRTLTFTTNLTTGFWINDICRWFGENLLPTVLLPNILGMTNKDPPRKNV